MKDTVVTIHGQVVGEVLARTTQAGVPMATFKVASTPRRPGRNRGEWSDGPTSVYSVACWRALARNVTNSLVVGTPVIVHGRLTQRPFSRQVGTETVKTVSADVDAFSVGPDLSQGIAHFEKDLPEPVRRAEERALREAAMAMHPAGSALRPATRDGAGESGAA